MANDFKRFAKPNVGTSTGASGDAVYSVPAGAGSSALESIIIGISICNKNSNDAYIVNGLKVPGNTTVEIMQGNKIVVQNDGSNADVIRAEASAGSSIDVVLSVLEDV